MPGRMGVGLVGMVFTTAASSIGWVFSKPVAIIAKTVKGKGVSYMENQVGWHGSAPNDELYEQAMAELKAQLNELQ